MADNVTYQSSTQATPPSGDVIAAQDVGGVKYQEIIIWGLTGNSTYQGLRVDAATHTLQTIDYAHHEIHSGSSYKVRSYTDAAVNTYYDIQITTPNTTSWAHLTFIIDVEKETSWWFYENVAINTPGDAITPMNQDRNSGNSSGLTLKYIANANEGAANDDTAVAGATLLLSGISGSEKKAGGQERSSYEIILKQNEDYSIRFKHNVAGYINYNLDWYEHTNRTA